MTRSIQPLKFGEEIIYIEVAEVEQQGSGVQDDDKLEDVNALGEIKDAADQIHTTIKALCKTVQSALADAQPNEWTLEINLGFKGSAGIPFISEGEANGAVKIIAKWG